METLFKLAIICLVVGIAVYFFWRTLPYVIAVAVGVLIGYHWQAINAFMATFEVKW